MKIWFIPFLVHDLVSARLLLYSSNIHIKHMFIIFMRIQVFFPVFPHIFFSIFSLLPDNHTANLGIFLDINHMCTDLSVRSGDRVTGPGNKLTSSGARMLLNCFKVRFSWHRIDRVLLFFFRKMFLGGLAIYCICSWICVHAGKCTSLEPSDNSTFSKC